MDSLLLLLWGGVIFALSSIPSLDSGLEHDFFLRKLVHMLEFGVLTVLLVRVLRHRMSSLRDLSLLASVAATFYAVTDEVHQLSVVGRHGTLRDVLIDSVGVFGSLVLLRMFPARSRKTQGVQERP